MRAAGSPRCGGGHYDVNGTLRASLAGKSWKEKLQQRPEKEGGMWFTRQRRRIVKTQWSEPAGMAWGQREGQRGWSGRTRWHQRRNSEHGSWREVGFYVRERETWEVLSRGQRWPDIFNGDHTSWWSRVCGSGAASGAEAAMVVAWTGEMAEEMASGWFNSAGAANGPPHAVNVRNEKERGIKVDPKCLVRATVRMDGISSFI